MIPDSFVVPLIDDLMRARAQRTPAELPEWLARLPLEDAYALQARHLERLAREIGARRIGTKLGGTTRAMFESLGISAPFRGPILSTTTHASGARLPRDAFFLAIVEAEVGLRLGRDVGGDDRLPTREELVDAIDVVVPAIEIADVRWRDGPRVPAAAIVADLGFAGAWIPGEPAGDARAVDIGAIEVVVTADGEEVRRGAASNVLGHPLDALALAVRELGARGERLRAGDWLTTGSLIAPYPAPGPAAIVADFGAFGRVSVTLG